jgi:membrane protease YdiL (CAAX protease family)
VLAGRAVWGEVGAVLAVGVVPYLISTTVFLALPPSPPRPYWLSALELTAVSSCIIFVTLYLIRRSGEPWGRFGLTRPRVWDVFPGLGLFLAAQLLWLFCLELMPWDGDPPPGDPAPRPRGPTDYALMVLQYGAAGFAEELVTRAYLVTRFEQLLRSRGAAVLWSSALFAAYHGYQGMVGVTSALAFGIAYGTAFLLLRRVWPLAIGHALYNIHIDLAA